MHKAKVLLHFIEDPSQASKLRFHGDKDTEETILNNLKMELHMMVFHSTETLFLNLFSIVKIPEYPWIWISQCTPANLLSLIQMVSNKGIDAVQESPEIWLRQNIFPFVKEDHENYAKSKKSTAFAIQYLRILAKEFLDHPEYNSYKHGLRSFVGKKRYQIFDDNTGTKLNDMQSDIIEFLEFQKKDSSGRPYTENGNPYTIIRLTTKGFDYVRDYRIIEMNSAILSNLIYSRKVSIGINEGESRTIGYYLFDNFTTDDIFSFSLPRHGNTIFRRFTS
jgi:hypothetical protein